MSVGQPAGGVSVTEEMLTAVLSGTHFSMDERIRRDAWPHPPLLLGDLIAHLARVVESRTWFPRPWSPAEPGSAVSDVTVIERRGPADFVVHFQRSGPSGVTVAEQGQQAFEKAEQAAAFYLKWELHLPGDLDGWKVVE
jgi:hypothetical protein